MEKSLLRNLLDTFFSLFEATITEYHEGPKSVTGSVSWEDEDDRQEFVWMIPDANFNLKLVAGLISYLGAQELTLGDKITLSKQSLVDRLEKDNWASTTAIEAISDLCSMRVGMLDNGEVTDSFLLHF